VSKKLSHGITVSSYKKLICEECIYLINSEIAFLEDLWECYEVQSDIYPKIEFYDKVEARIKYLKGMLK